MAGIALALDLLKRNHAVSTHSLHSHGLLSAAAAAAAAAAVVTGKPLGSRLFGDGGIPIAYCDASTAWNEEYIPNLRRSSENIFQHDSVQYRTKEYLVEPKPLFSAFAPKTLAITSLRSLLLFYLPLLEPQPPVEEDDDFLQDDSEERHVDLVTPFKKSLKQIVRETTVVTIRRVLERFTVHHVSRRMAWKLLKDASKSAKRKAGRGMPTLFFVYSVSRTTFRGHFLGVAASWFVQIGIEIYRCFFRKANNDSDEEIHAAEKLRLLGKKVYGSTIKCGASLIFASIGAGAGALIHPSMGQWIGCALGDFAGPVIAIIVFEKLHLEL